MTTMDCKTFRSLLPDLLLSPEAAPQPTMSEAARTHLSDCVVCRAEFDGMRATFVLLDEWPAPEPSPYFDARVRAHLREAQAAAPEGLWDRVVATFRFSTGRRLRSAVAGGFVFLLLLSGGTVATLWDHHGPTPAASSPAVNDLKIYDNNAQAIQQMDMLDQSGSDASTIQPQS